MTVRRRGVVPMLAAVATAFVVALSLAVPSPIGAPKTAAPAAKPTALDELHVYVHEAWTTLTRPARDLPTAAVDPKFPARGGKVPVYLARREDGGAIRARLAAVLPAAELA